MNVNIGVEGTSRAATAKPASRGKCFTNIEHLEFDSFRTPPGSVASSRRAQAGAASPEVSGRVGLQSYRRLFGSCESNVELAMILAVWAESLAQGCSFGGGEAYADMVPLTAFGLVGCESRDEPVAGSLESGAQEF